MSIPKAEKYVLDFEQHGLGLFVHWGLYSQLGKGEWIFHESDIEMDEYKKLKDSFTAEDFDAEKLVLTAKNTGCKYITLTTRHHEGFSLYDTCGLNDFDAPHSPAKRDLIKEFVDACNKHGIVPFFYHTTLDWYNKDFDENFDEYLEYLRKSVETLCKNYGKIGGLWFDGNWSKPNSDWKETELYKTIRKYQPEAIIVNNTGLENRGRTGNPEIDSVTYERGKPIPINREGMEKYVAGEMCETINDHWGIGNFDVNYKSPAELIKTLCACRMVGTNLLLNIGPTAQGGVDPYQEQLLNLIGRWMGIFGEAIYNGRPVAAKSTSDNFVLKSVNGDALYIFAHDLGQKGNINVVTGKENSGVFAFSNVKDEIKTIKWMDNDEELSFSQSGDVLSVNLTAQNYGDSFVVRVAKAELK